MRQQLFLKFFELLHLARLYDVGFNTRELMREVVIIGGAAAGMFASEIRVEHPGKGERQCCEGAFIRIAASLRYPCLLFGGSLVLRLEQPLVGARR